MIGAIVGDITANRYGATSKHVNQNTYTTISTFIIALCDALISVDQEADQGIIKESINRTFYLWERKYPDQMEYVPPFLFIASIGWLYDSLERTLEVAFWVAEMIDNRFIKECTCLAACIYLARKKYSKEQIQNYVLLASFNDNPMIQLGLQAFYNGNNYQSVIYNALDNKHDEGKIATIAGAVAEAYYNVPNVLFAKGLSVISKDMENVFKKFYQKIRHEDPFLNINEEIEFAIAKYNRESNEANFKDVLYSIDVAMDFYSHIIIPVLIETLYDSSNEKKHHYKIKKKEEDGKLWYYGFTSHKEMEIGDPTASMITSTRDYLEYTLSKNVEGIIIDPYSYHFKLNKQSIRMILSIGYIYNRMCN